MLTRDLQLAEIHVIMDSASVCLCRQREFMWEWGVSTAVVSTLPHLISAEQLCGRVVWLTALNWSHLTFGGGGGALLAAPQLLEVHCP